MFIGHYGVSFAVKRRDATLPLWVLFLAVQLLDVVWAPFVLLGIEKVRIVPGITRSNPLDLYYMPFTHSLVAAILWSLGAADLLVHRPDLPLYDNAAKVGLGLWNVPAVALGLEAFLVFGGILLCSQARLVRGLPTVVFGVVMLAIQAYVFFGPPPASAHAAALTALVSYALFAGVIHLFERRRSKP